MNALAFVAGFFVIGGAAAASIPSERAVSLARRLLEIPGILYLAGLLRLLLGLVIVLSVPRWSIADFIGWLTILAAFVPLFLKPERILGLVDTFMGRPALRVAASLVVVALGVYLMMTAQSL
ncbi:MAG: hypothetical protein ISN29_11725 [Gammaproteobacteria bacterium AqS3]|nr:hypothetical protein [Gammaproteobacteria bacterium AqS3]